MRPGKQVSAVAARALAPHVDHVYGVMGNGNALFLDALLTSTDAGFTAMRHEVGGVVAADAHFRASGRLACATATYGPGFTNTLTGLAEAAQARVPLVLVVGDQPTSGPRPWDIDQVAMAEAAGVRTFTVGQAEPARTVADAVWFALTQQTPVVLAIPYDLAKTDADECAAVDLAPLPAPVTPDADQVAALVDLLAGARRPLLLAGRGAWLADAGTDLGRLADALGALTASTALARGIFPDQTHDLGITGGFGAEAAMQTIHDADVAVVFGAGLNQFTMRFGDLFAPGTTVVQVDVADAATNPRVDRFVRGDVRLVARALTEGLGSRDQGEPAWREVVSASALGQRELGAERCDDGRLDPRAVAAKLADLLPDDRVVVQDGGHFIGWANMYWPVHDPFRMIMVGTAFQSIGLGWPSAVGAAIARPESTIVLSTGDGGGLMALADLESAVRVAGGRGLAVVWNDAAYGAEVNLYGLQGLDQRPMLIPEVDFAALAASVGAEGVVVRTLADLDRLGDWARTPASERRFLVLDCRISSSVVAPYQREIIRVNSR